MGEISVLLNMNQTFSLTRSVSLSANVSLSSFGTCLCNYRRTYAPYWNTFLLQTYFEDNPRDLHMLRHDKTIHTVKVHQHLRNVPEYLGITFVFIGGAVIKGMHSTQRYSQSRWIVCCWQARSSKTVLPFTS